MIAFVRQHKDVFKNLDRIILAGLAVLILLYAASGIYVVEANQAAVLRRFGSVLETVGPGIHYRLPWPVDQVNKVSIRQVKTMNVGFSPNLQEKAREYTTITPYCLTGDQNIIHASFSIQYRISDPAKYLFKVNQPEAVLRNQANQVILTTIAQRGVDPLLTTGKRQLEMTIRKDLVEAIKDSDLGLSLVSIETRQIQPPDAVKDAFKDVINAREERSTAIHQANNYKNKVLPGAKAKAQGSLKKARSQAFAKVTAAQGESSRFSQLFKEYANAPRVTRERLFLELVDKALPRVKVYVTASDKKGNPVKLKLVHKKSTVNSATGGETKDQTAQNTPQARREFFLQKRPELPPDIAESIRQGRVIQGMTQEQVTASLGEPEQVTVLTNNPAGDERWDYNQEFIFFKGSQVESWVAEY
jgi:membrane protease subunit HflK